MPTQISLDRFGVPFEGGRQGPMLMPKKKFLFRVRFLNFGTIGNTASDLTFNAATVSFPKLTQDIQEVHAYNSIAYYGGKSKWDPVELTVRDDVTNAVNRNVDAQLQRQMDHFNQTGYRSATDYKFTAFLEVMDGGNDAVLEQWFLEGCFISEHNPGDMDYSSSEMKTISLTLRYDNATHYDEQGNLMMSTPASDPQGSTL